MTDYTPTKPFGLPSYNDIYEGRQEMHERRMERIYAPLLKDKQKTDTRDESC